MQKCKQCLRLLPKQNFRVVKSRSTGARKSRGDSLRSVCKQCENMNVQAHQLLKLPLADAVRTDKWRSVVQYFRILRDGGVPITLGAAAQVLAIVDGLEGRVSTKHAEPAAVTTPTYDTNELYQHIYKLRTRSYSSFDEADTVHKSLVGALTDAGLYEEANNLIDEWFEEDE